MPIPIRDLPPGWYQVELWAGNTRVASREIEVGEIRKPSYTIAVATDRHVLVEGDPFTVHVTSTFFDGTPVPGLDLALHGTDIDGGDGAGRRTTTSAEGQAAIGLVAAWPDQWRRESSVRDISVAPVTPEESDIPDLSTGYVVLPARLILDAKAEVDGATLQVRGAAHLLDQAGAEREWLATAGAEWNPDGPPAAGARVHIRVVDHWDVPVRTGRAYDFITKRAYDTYTYKHRDRVIADADVKVAPDGTLRLDVARTMGSVAAPKGHEYAVTVSGRDRDGRAVEAAAWAYAPWSAEFALPREDDPLPSLGWDEDPESRGFAIGAEMRLPLTWRGGQPPTERRTNRYLFLTATRGLRSVLVSESPVFVHPFSAHDLPNAAIDAVWFTGDRYVAAGSAWVEFDRADRELTVTLTPDASRHAPGDTVRLSVRTADGSGRPGPRPSSSGRSTRDSTRSMPPSRSRRSTTSTRSSPRGSSRRTPPIRSPAGTTPARTPPGAAMVSGRYASTSAIWSCSGG